MQALTTLMLILLEVSTTFKRGAAEVKRRCCCCCRLRWGKSSVELLSKLLSKPRDRSPPVLDYNPDLTRSGTTLKNFKVLTVFKSEQSELSAAGLAPAAEGGVSASTH